MIATYTQWTTCCVGFDEKIKVIDPIQPSSWNVEKIPAGFEVFRSVEKTQNLHFGRKRGYFVVFYLPSEVGLE